MMPVVRDDEIKTAQEKVAQDRNDFIQSSDELLDRFEQLAEGTRRNLTQATGQISQLMDKAEETLNRVSNPAKFVAENPKLAISALLFSGIFLGLFFSRTFATENSVRPKARRIGNVA